MRISQRWLLPSLLLISLAHLLPAQTPIKVMQYNLLRYGAAGISCTPTGVTARNAWFSTIMNEAQPDIFGVNEVGPASGPTAPATNIINNILKPINSAYEAANVTFNGSQDVANAFFYNSAKLGLKAQAVIPHTLRNIDYYKLYYKGPGLAAGDTTWIEVVVVHLHSSDASIRASQTSAIMTYLDGLNRAGNFLVMGDMNMDGSSATAYQNMVGSANADIKLNDPIGLNGTWSNNNNARHAWTQSTRSSGSSDCGSGGGLDDRFDIILASNAIMNNTDDVRYVPSSYRVFGNTNAPNPSVSSGAAAALVPMSDHFPVMLTLEVSRAVSAPDPLPGFSLNIASQPCDHAIQAVAEVPGGMEGDWQASLIDLGGREIATQSHLWGAGRSQLSFPSDHLQAGIYLLRLQAPDGASRTWRVAVAHP